MTVSTQQRDWRTAVVWAAVVTAAAVVYFAGISYDLIWYDEAVSAAIASHSFADIFRGNSLKNGLLPIVVDRELHGRLFALVVADPDRHYLGEVMDLDRAVAMMSEKKRDFDRCFVFIHNDAGVTYAATMSAMVRRRDRTIFSIWISSIDGVRISV